MVKKSRKKLTHHSADLISDRQSELGQHGEAVRTVNWCADYNALVTGGWDSMMKVWDPRQTDPLVGTYQQPERVYAADISSSGRVIIGTAARHVWIWDMRNMVEPEQRRISSLKFQTRCIRAFPDGSGYALSSTEGRVSMEFFDTSKAVQDQKYVFKCHRGIVDKVDYAYPVNTIAFRPGTTQFATGGGDCCVPIWDTAAKKRLLMLPKYPTSIASLDFSSNGQYLAIASSYTFEELDKPHPPDQIFIRTMGS